MDDTMFNQIIHHITYALESNGYNPYIQLTAYLKTDDPSYITRQDNARQLILQLDKKAIQQYIDLHFK